MYVIVALCVLICVPILVLFVVFVVGAFCRESEEVQANEYLAGRRR